MMGRWIPDGDFRRQLAVPLLFAGVAEVVLLAFRFLDWEFGVLRGCLLLVLVALVVLAQRHTTLGRYQPGAPLDVPVALRWFARVLVALNLAVGVVGVIYTAHTGDIRSDQGNNTYRAARVLLAGDNPYAPGALLDLNAFHAREKLRREAGVGSVDTGEDGGTRMARYWQTLDPATRATLLPPASADASPAARRETSILGYKYGPVLFLAVAALAVPCGPSAVPLINLLCYAAWMWILWRIFARVMRPLFATSAMIAVLLEGHIAYNFLFLSTSDVWVLLCCSLAVLAVLTGRHTILGLALACALGCKLFPAVLFMPLLLRPRSWRPLLAFGVGVVLILGPWLAWDARGLFNNLVLWPALMGSDSTSWVHFASPRWVAAARGVLGLGVLGLCAGLMTGAEHQLFRRLTLANLCVVLAGSVFHNNYIPWFSVWIFAGLGLAFSSASARGAAVPGDTRLC